MLFAQSLLLLGLVTFLINRSCNFEKSRHFIKPQQGQFTMPVVCETQSLLAKYIIISLQKTNILKCQLLNSEKMRYFGMIFISFSFF